jgi:hypothetical protein
MSGPNHEDHLPPGEGGPVQNTDTMLWRDDEGNQVHRTADGQLGIGVGGFVQVAPLADWSVRVRLPGFDEADLDSGYVDRLVEATKVDRGSVALVLGAHLANQHAAEHRKPRAYGAGRPTTFPPNMSTGTVAEQRGRWVPTDEDLAVLARETEGL